MKIIYNNKTLTTKIKSISPNKTNIKKKNTKILSNIKKNTNISSIIKYKKK